MQIIAVAMIKPRPITEKLTRKINLTPQERDILKKKNGRYLVVELMLLRKVAKGKSTSVVS